MRNSIAIYRLLRLMCALVLLSLIPISPLAAKVKQMSLNDKPLSLIKKFATLDKRFPRSLETDQDVYVVIYATSTTSDVYVLARPSVDPKQLAHKLEAAVKGTELASRPVMYMHRKGFSWADAFIDHSQMWSREAEMRHPVGLIISRLSSAGLKPHVLLCNLKTAERSHKLNLIGLASRKWIASNVDPKRTDLDFSLRARLSSHDVIKGLLLLFTLPVIGIVAFPVLLYIARVKRNTPQGRRSLFTGSYFWLMIVCNGVALAILTNQIRSPWRYRLQDIWFGEGYGPLWFILPVLIPLVFIALSRLVARMAFRGAASEYEANVRKRNWRMWVAFFPFMVVFMAVDRLADFLPKASLLARYEFVVVIVAWFTVERIYNHIVRNRRTLPGSRMPDDKLFHRLSGLALQFGINLTQVNLVESPPSRKRRADVVLCRNGMLLIHSETAEKLEPEELYFLVVHEFAHKVRQHRVKTVLANMAGTLLMIVPGIPFIIRPLNLSVTNWQLWCIAAGFVLLFIDGIWFIRRREQEADRIALSLTRDPESAAQAVMKASGLLDISPSDLGKDAGALSLDTLATSRLQWLKKSAEAMGLNAESGFGKVEEDDALTLRAQEIAACIGTKVNKVQVIDPATGKPLVNAGALPKGRLIVGRALVESFTREEIDFVLAHEIAHLKCRHLIKMFAGIIVSLIAIVIGAMPLLLGNVPQSGYPIWIMLIAIPLFMGNLTWLSRRREMAADRIALRFTRNLPAAISVIKKLTASNPMEIPEELETYLTHPKEIYRLQSLRREARKMGLTEMVSHGYNP